ncbi:MAG: hypothetical protein NZL89_01785 [Leptospiraceae bacterium]|nr:hypothetical protein [Leptospiraceae bacterium]
MGRLARYAIFYALYVAAGMAVLFAHYYAHSAYDAAKLDADLTRLVMAHDSQPSLIDALPQLFRENPHAAALRITNFRGDFLGAMYDARRMAKEEYKSFLTQKTPTPGTLPYELYLWESKGRKLRIAVLSLRRMQFSTYLAGMAERYLGQIAALYLLTGALIFWALAAFRHGSIKPARAQPKDIKMQPVPHAWQNRPGTLSENTIRSFLHELYQMSGALSAALFIRRTSFLRSHWEGFLELSGGLWIRGEGMALEAPPHFSEEASYWVSSDRKRWYFFDGERSLCVGLAFEKPTELSPELQQKILERLQEKSTLLAKEWSYENAILDKDGLYSAPYAIFCLKERLLSGRAFAAALLKLAPLDQNAIRTTIRILRQHFAADCAPLVARVGHDTILVIFSQKTESAAAEQATRKLFAALQAMAKNPGCGFVADCVLAGNAEQVLRRLEHLAKRSAEKGAFENWVFTKPLSII